MKTKPYIQCELEKNNKTHIAWIDSNFAEVGKNLKIKIDGKWENNWIVKKCYFNIKIDSEKITNLNQQYKHTREVSDI